MLNTPGASALVFLFFLFFFFFFYFFLHGVHACKEKGRRAAVKPLYARGKRRFEREEELLLA